MLFAVKCSLCDGIYHPNLFYALPKIDLSQEEPCMVLYTASSDHAKPKVAIAES